MATRYDKLAANYTGFVKLRAGCGCALLSHGPAKVLL